MRLGHHGGMRNDTVMRPDLVDQRWRPTGRVAIFDLDRTLLPGSSLVLLGKALVERGVIPRSVLARHAAQAAIFSRRGLADGRIARLRESLLAAAAGRDHDQIVSVAREVGGEMASNSYPAARWLLRQHQEAGDFCIVLSASPQELVEAVAAALGAHRAVGTCAEVVDGRLTGRLFGPFCHGPGKLERLATDLGPVELASATAYADSASDLPLLSSCGHPVAVNPDRRLWKAAQAAGWPVLRFS